MMPEKFKYTFQLFAPYNNQANLIADFNNWQEISLEKAEDGYFRAEVELADGIYQYKYNIQSKSWFYPENDWKSIADPYATEIDPETQNSILRLKNGKKIIDEYSWNSNDVPLPENSQMVIYEMHVGDFSGGEADDFTRGQYPDVIAKLDYLLELGINAVELMPLKESPGDFNWGYSPVHYFAPETNYGASFQLKELIDKCHAVGIRVIVDGVYNHANPDTPLAQIDHDYWFCHDPKDPVNNWGPEFNFGHFDEHFQIKPALKFIDDSIRFWIQEYQIDGIRFDAARQIGNFEILGSFVSTAREMASMKPFYTVAEFIPPEPAVTEPFGPVESCWNDSFMYAMVEYLSGQETNLEKIKNAVNPLGMGYAGATSVTNYLANHDQNRLLRKLGEHSILGTEAFRRAKLGALILLTAVGIPMIWMGEEFGEFAPLSESSNKIDWSLLANEENKQLLNYYKTLITLRKTHPAFTTSNLEFFHEDTENNVLCFQRFNEDGNVVVVILNLSDNELENYTVSNFPADGAWHEWTKDYDTEILNQHITLSLPHREGLVFVKT